ncbi:von Willebrand factor D and EGF domain-containing protein-like [Dendronephthya gigantea]|uniref:von Willebrand factor D and EGF domain-containing protein-like n=1 Tax=Dendronephthya gigantea TaxID=151771 RepID=UPI0010693FCF|nr:von Willebrand factor D and EGF domain-containing protein-like [Dendronephthya gigantea]
MDRANDARNVNVFALSVDVSPCVDDSTRHVCVSLKKHSPSSSSILRYCSHTSLGSPLVTIDANGLVSLVGVLHQKTGCQTQRNLVGTFSRIDHGRKWIRKTFRIQDHPQCQPSVYRTLDDPLRDLSKTRESYLCDTELPRAWYRFKLDGRPAELPTVCPARSACGTSSSIWLPRAENIELGRQVEIKACVSWNVGARRLCCSWKLSVFVRHCGDFKVYRLTRTDFCPTAYCANVSRGVCGPGQTGYKPNCVESYPNLPKVLQFYPLHAYQGNPKRPYIYLRCLLRGARGENTIRYLFYLHKITKRSDGRILKTTIHRTETSRTYFDVRLIPERVPVRLGDTVICEARAFFQATRNTKSPALRSQDYHLGVKVHPSSTSLLTYPNVVTITFAITLPVLCRIRDQSCSLTIPLNTSLTDATTGKAVSSGSHFSLSKCSLVFTTEPCNRNKVICGRDSLHIQAGRNFETSDRKLRINLGPIISTGSVWTNYRLPVVEVRC